MGEWSFFQIEPGTIGDGWAKGDAGHQLRHPGIKMSNFGALRYGDRSSTDYTQILYGFPAKATMEGSDKFGLHDLVQDGEKNENPYVWGSTVKTVRDDQFIRMGMSMGGLDQLGLNTAPNAQITEPKFDVMDTDVVQSGMVSGKNYPTEGWRSFGGKYDRGTYDGTLR